MRHAARVSVVLGLFLASTSHAVVYECVADINPGFGSGGGGDLTVYDGDLYFIANNVAHGSNSELWKYDGTNVTQAAEIKPGPDGSGINSLCVYDDTLYFSARDDDGTLELWSYSPGVGAAEVPDNNPAWNPQTHAELIACAGSLFYRATDFSTVGTELGRFDGTTQHVVNISPGTGTSYPQGFIVYNGDLHFLANGADGAGSELYKYNGGPTRLTDIYPGSDAGDVRHMAVYDGDIYCSAKDGIHGNELWRYDPVTGAELVADIEPGGIYDSGDPANMTPYKGKLYFTADDEGDAGNELWRYDVATDTAELFWNINQTPPPTGGEDPEHHSWASEFFEYNGLLYFAADDGVHGRELWATDGDTCWLVLDIMPGEYGSGVGGFCVWEGDLYFAANDGQTGSEVGYITGEYTETTAIFRIPEPATLVLLAAGAGLVGMRRRRK
jgi:ELWxxDGT repeat protein